MQRLTALLGEQNVMYPVIAIYTFNCDTKKVDCDKLEELENEANQIIQKMNEVNKEMRELKPYYDLCL